MSFIEVDGSGFIIVDGSGFIQVGASGSEGPSMSDSLDQVIDIQITVTDKAPSRPSFGVPLIAAYHTQWVDLVHEYTDADELLDEGFTTSSPAYQMATAIKAQDPSPSRFKVGRRATAATQTIHLIPTSTVQGFVYSGTINGQAFTYTVGASATVQIIVEAIAPIITALTGVTATEDNTKVVVTTDTAGAVVAYDLKPRAFRVIDATPDSGIAADMGAIAGEDNDWYGLVVDNNSEAVITAAAVWTEANGKIFFPQSGDWDVVDAGESTDVASVLEASSYTRTAGIFHRKIGGAEWAGAAFLSVVLVDDPGEATPAFKTLATISADNLKAGELTALENKNFTRYSEMGGLNVTFEGRTPSGRFIDVVRFVDWLEAEMKADVFAVLVNNKKVPFTADGISAIKGAILGTLNKGVKRGGLDPDTTAVVTAPSVAEVSLIDRANRTLPDVKFSHRTSGALHRIKIRGTLSV